MILNFASRIGQNVVFEDESIKSAVPPYFNDVKEHISRYPTLLILSEPFDKDALASVAEFFRKEFPMLEFLVGVHAQSTYPKKNMQNFIYDCGFIKNCGKMRVEEAPHLMLDSFASKRAEAERLTNSLINTWGIGASRSELESKSMSVAFLSGKTTASIVRYVCETEEESVVESGEALLLQKLPVHQRYRLIRRITSVDFTQGSSTSLSSGF